MPGLADDKSACLGLWLLDSRGALLEKREGSTEETFGKKLWRPVRSQSLGSFTEVFFRRPFCWWSSVFWMKQPSDHHKSGNWWWMEMFQRSINSIPWGGIGHPSWVSHGVMGNTRHILAILLFPLCLHKNRLCALLVWELGLNGTAGNRRQCLSQRGQMLGHAL